MNENQWKTMLAVLWLVQIGNYAAYILISIIESAGSEAIASTENGIGIAIFFFLPSVLAWLTLAAKPGVSRWPNIVLGTMFTLIKVFASGAAAVGAIGRGDGTFQVAIFANEFWAIFAAAGIVWYAWRRPNP